MFYPCPTCKDNEGAIQDWRPESVIHMEEDCVICGKSVDKDSKILTVRFHLGCQKCKKAHCLKCVHEYTFRDIPTEGAQS